MTFNRDPDSPMRDRMRVRRDDGSWSALPILGVLAVVIAIGLILAIDWNATTDRPIGEPTARTAPPATSTPPATTPPTGPRQ